MRSLVAFIRTGRPNVKHRNARPWARTEARIACARPSRDLNNSLTTQIDLEISRPRLFTRETGACPSRGRGQHFSWAVETVARSTDTARTRCSDPSPTLFIRCNGLRDRWVNDPHTARIRPCNVATLSLPPRDSCISASRPIRPYPPADCESCSTG
jgi:hypothetical protein